MERQHKNDLSPEETVKLGVSNAVSILLKAGFTIEDTSVADRTITLRRASTEKVVFKIEDDLIYCTTTADLSFGDTTFRNEVIRIISEGSSEFSVESIN